MNDWTDEIAEAIDKAEGGLAGVLGFLAEYVQSVAEDEDMDFVEGKKWGKIAEELDKLSEKALELLEGE